ncbi:Uncharacterized protein HZ326_31059 [Fusarium oxysporum f. sp. albedinis]|nr:Uncharacterized protein HZ326_31059 [Fusarium oxysporum f. sp. albedinis]
MLCYVYFSSGGPLAPKSLLLEHRTCWAKLSKIAAVLILARIICKASWIGAVYMLERFLYSSPQKAPLYS